MTWRNFFSVTVNFSFFHIVTQIVKLWNTGRTGSSVTIHPKEMAVALKQCIFDPMLVKPKCVWEVADFLKNCKQRCKQIFQNWKDLSPFKHILSLSIQHGVKYAPFQSYNHFFLVNSKWNTVYIVCFEWHRLLWYFK